MHFIGRILFLAAMIFSTPLWAAECEVSQDPSPQTEEASGINFYNDTQYAFKVLWADHDGFLTEYGMVQPSETLKLNTFVGHSWFVEMYTPDKTECLGPIKPNQAEACQAHILWNDGIGIDAGYCDF